MLFKGKIHNTVKTDTTKLAKVIYHLQHSMERNLYLFFLTQQGQNIYQHFIFI